MTKNSADFSNGAVYEKANHQPDLNQPKVRPDHNHGGRPPQRLDESNSDQSGQIMGTSTRLTARKSSINGSPTLT